MKRTGLFILAGVVTVLGEHWAWAALGGASGVTIPYRGQLEWDGTAVTGNVDFVFQIFHDTNPSTAPCDSEASHAVPVVGGELAVVISGIAENCVKGRDIYVGRCHQSQRDLGAAGGPSCVMGRQQARGWPQSRDVVVPPQSANRVACGVSDQGSYAEPQIRGGVLQAMKRFSKQEQQGRMTERRRMR